LYRKLLEEINMLNIYQKNQEVRKCQVL